MTGIPGWKVALAAGALAAAFASGYAYRGKPPAPAVALHEDTASQRASASASDTQDSKGSEREVTRTFAPPAPGCPRSRPVLASETVITRGPEVITQHASEQVAQADQSHVSLVVTPPVERPGWAVGGSIEDLPGARLLRLELDRRLFGNLWVTAGIVPARRELGIGLRMEW